MRRAVWNRRLVAQAFEFADGTSRGACDEHLDLRKAVARLPVGQRLVVSLHFGEGFGVDEIAAAHGLPPGTVKSRLFAAREALRKYLEGERNAVVREVKRLELQIASLVALVPRS